MMPMDVEEAQVVQRLANKPLDVILTAVTAEDPWIYATERKAAGGEEGQR